MIWVGVGVLRRTFGFEILEEKGLDLSKEEERRRGSGLQRSGHGSGERETQKGGEKMSEGAEEGEG